MRSKVLIGIFAVLLLSLPFIGDNYLLRLATTVLMYSVLALSWNFIGGLAGYPSFATAAFFGIGAYTGAILQVAGMPMFLAWVFAGVVASILAAFLGVILLRLRGHYFAIASLVVAEVLREVANSWTDLTGGGMGLNLPILRIGVNEQAMIFYYAMLVMALAALLLSVFVDRNRLGFGLRCIQQNEDAANSIGVNTTLYKSSALVLSAVFSGMAGAFYASWVNYIEPADVFDVLISVKPIVMVLLGGAGTVIGPIVGAFSFLILEELVWRNVLEFHAGLLGLIIVVLVFFLPGGLLMLRIVRNRKEGVNHG